MLKRTFEPLEPYAPIFLRLVAGVIFMLHGWQHLQNPTGFAGFVGSLGFPAPAFFAWLVILMEIGGGLLLILGLGTRLVAASLALEMLITTLMVKSKVGIIAGQGQGTGAELDLLLLAASVTLLILGAGALSIDESVIENRGLTEGRRTA